MREFSVPADRELEAQIREAAASLLASAPTARLAYGREFAMDAEDLLVMREVDVRWPDSSERFRIAETLPEARPPFEWLIEITSDLGEAAYIKHYLIRDHDIMFAQRKVLTPIDNEEARTILADLAKARTLVQDQLN